MFSVALATVLFPALSRLAARGDLAALGRTMANGVRQIFLMLIPCAAFTLVLATPITRLVYERGAFDQHSVDLVSEALFWFSFSLPFAGVNLLMTRTFFSLQKPWAPTALAAANMLLNALVSVLLYKPFGVAGLVIGTAVASMGMTLGQGYLLQRRLGQIEVRATVTAFVVMTAAAALAAGVAYGVWWSFDRLLGGALPAEIVSVGGALAAGTAVYVGIVLLLRIREAEQVKALLTSRLRKKPA